MAADESWIFRGRRQRRQPAQEPTAPAIQIAEPDVTVWYIPLRCPKCRSKEIKFTHTDHPVRYHRCKECGLRFKSVEKDL